MKQLRWLDTWPVWRKVLVTAGLIGAVIAGVVLSDPEAFPVFLILGLVGLRTGWLLAGLARVLSGTAGGHGR